MTVGYNGALHDTSWICSDVHEEHDDGIDAVRSFEVEDLEHLRDAIDEIKTTSRATALPGLESAYNQIRLRVLADRRREERRGAPGTLRRAIYEIRRYWSV